MSKGTGIAGAQDYHAGHDAFGWRCCACGRHRDTASYAARVLPPLVQACSAECMRVMVEMTPQEFKEKWK